MPSPSPPSPPRRRKRDQGPGQDDGIVVDLEQIGGGVYDIAYVITARIGRENPQNVSLQVDTGSSDLWVTSTDCTSDLCDESVKYDPSNSTPSGQVFSINYLQGEVSGPIVWDRVEIGGYAIDNQALAAADNIDSEPLSHMFNGILGLALPLNSIIAEFVPPGTSDSPDGAAWPSNLFSTTPFSLAPSARFLSLSLSRPGSSQLPSLLGIGRHPEHLPATTPLDPSKIQYSTLVPDALGTLYWKASIRAITVYTNGEGKDILLPRSITGRPWPTAVLDSGVPLILTTSTIANAIYGGIGIGPADDGQYYVPCDQPLNITITLDDRSETSLHPLDLTAEPPRDNQASFCVGLIQAADPYLLPADPTDPTSASSSIGDMILGVPFMRNVYTVLAFVPPNTDGTFANGTDVDPDDVDEELQPRIGLLGLTDPIQALKEFDNVRKNNRPIDDTPGSPHGENNGGQGNGLSGNATSSASETKHLSVGIIVLIALLSFFAFCALLFAARWFLLRRRERKAMLALQQSDAAGGGGAAMATLGALGRKRTSNGGRGDYQLARRLSDEPDDGLPSEDALREIRYKEYIRKHGLDSESGMLPKADGSLDDESRSWDPETALQWEENAETLVGGRRGKSDDRPPPSLADFLPKSFNITTVSDRPLGSSLSSRTVGTGMFTVSDGNRYPKHGGSHNRSLSVAMPLLPLVQEESEPSPSPQSPPREQRTSPTATLPSASPTSFNPSPSSYKPYQQVRRLPTLASLPSTTPSDPSSPSDQVTPVSAGATSQGFVVPQDTSTPSRSNTTASQSADSARIGGGLAGVGTMTRGSANLNPEFRALPTPPGLGTSGGVVPPSLPVGPGTQTRTSSS